MSIAAERLARDEASQSGFFLGLADRGISWPLPLIDRSFGDAPALAIRRGHESNFDSSVSDAIRNHRGLL
jgi:hypothetical protein